MDSTVAYLNGEFVPSVDAKLPVHDAGFVFGATVTDLVRTFRKKPFRLEDHLSRFRESCNLAHMPQLVPDERLRDVATELIDRNAQHLSDSAELNLVMCATPGPVGHYVGDAANGPPTLLMHTFPLPFARYANLFTHGARLAVPATRAPSPRAVDPRIKQRSRLHWWIANAEARAIDSDADALLCDEAGNVTETSSANLLLVRGGEVIRAPAGTVLEGVSMLVVRELCESLGIRFREQRISLDDCYSADELLVTCTTWCVAGVSALNNRPIPWPGPTLKGLQAAWSDAVGVDIVAPFTDAR